MSLYWCVLPCDNVIVEGGMVFGKRRNEWFWLPFLDQVLFLL